MYQDFNQGLASIDSIDKQIQNLSMLKNRLLQTPQPAPVQNIINTNTTNNIEMEGKILKNGQNINDIIVQNRTLFIDEANRRVAIKETDGSISKQYEIIIPLTREQQEILELKKNNNILVEKIKKMEVMLNGYDANDESSKANQDVEQSPRVDNGNAKSATKKSTK